MKHTFLSIVSVMLGLTANSQVITVRVQIGQNFTHSNHISTVYAMENDLLEYPNYTLGENIYTFDLNNRIVQLENCNGHFECELIEINLNENILDCKAFDGIGNVLFLLGVNNAGERQFLFEWIENEKVIGTFSMNDGFSYKVE